METRELIIETANRLLIERGYNAFSYKNISKDIGIKTSSIHYHFPVKSDLGVAVVRRHQKALDMTIERTKDKPAVEKLQTLLMYYRRLIQANQVCIIGALTSDVNTLEEPIRVELVNFGNAVISWAKAILEEGQEQKAFRNTDDTAIRARLLVTNLMAIVQVARIEKGAQSSEKLLKMLTEDMLMSEN